MNDVRDIESGVRKYLDTVRIIDTHEHLDTEEEFRGAEMDFGRLFLCSANCDLISAGCPPEDIGHLQNNLDMSPREKWRLIAPYWKYIRGTGYARSLERALRDLYGIESLNADSVDTVTEKMRSNRRPGFYREVFDKAGIAVALWNRLDRLGPIPRMWSPEYDQTLFVQDLLAPYLRLDLQRSSFSPPRVCREWRDGWGREIRCLDDYLGVIEERFDAYASGAAALKIGIAYLRSLRFEERSRPDVEPLFDRLLRTSRLSNESPLTVGELLAVQDYLVHFSMRLCARHHLGVKFHTGLQEGNGNIIGNSRAALLTNLFFKYPDVKFDIYHISYPYQEELVTLVKNFPNVAVDFCLMWIINPAAARRALSDFLDAVPANKILGFGGDCVFIEGSYGHAMLAKDGIAGVLAEKISEGSMTERRARDVAAWLLRDNPIEWFDLRAKRPGPLR